jgi:hypothetical protein
MRRALTRALAVLVAVSGLATVADARHAGAADPEPRQAVRFDNVVYPTTGCGSVTVTRMNGADPAPDGQLQVASLGGDSELLPLQQTAPDAWSTSVCVGPGPIQSGDGVLQVAPGDHVMAATRTGGVPSGMDVASVRGGPSNGGVNVTLNPQPLPPRVRSILNPEYAAGLGPKRLKNARLIQPDGSVVYFAEDQVILREATPGDLQAFMARHPKSALLNSLTLDDPEASPGGPTTVTYHLLYVNAAKYPTTDIASQLELAGATGAFEFTSKRSIELYALLLDEQMGATQVFPNTLALRNSTPSTDEAINSPTRLDLFNSPGDNNPKTPGDNKWMQGSNAVAQRVGAPQTLALLDLMKQHQKPRTKVAILDGGFAAPSDYGTMTTQGDYGVAFSSIDQCSANMIGKLSCGDPQAAGKNPSPCGGSFGACPWHGAQMVAAAAGRIDNGGPASDGGGSGGIGGMTAELLLYKADWTYFFPLAASITNAMVNGARVINMSSGFPCMNFIDLCDGATRFWVKGLMALACLIGNIILGIACALAGELLDLFANVTVLELAVNQALAAGVVVVSAAGNKPENATDKKTVPCVWPGVVCVGALDISGGDLVPGVWGPDSSSAFGPALSFWAPGTGVGGFPTPAPVSTASNGTSPAAAFTSGVASIVRSIAPNLSGAHVRQLLADAVCRTGHTTRVNGANCTPSANATVDANGYLDVLDVLHRARAAANMVDLTRCTGGWDQLNSPNDLPQNPRLIPGVPFTWAPSGQLGQWSGDATVKSPRFTPNDQPDGQWYSVSFNQSTIPLNAPPALNIKLELRVPDPSLGALTMEVFAVTASGPPPVLKVNNPYHVVDSTSGNGTAEWRGYMGVKKQYLVHVIATQPEGQNNNCFDRLTVTSMEGFGNPPPREAGLELGIPDVIVGRKAENVPGSANLAIVPVTLTQPTFFPVTADFYTYDGTAKAGVDYAASSGTINIPSGETYTEIAIPIFPKANSKGGAFGVGLTNHNAPLYVGNTFVVLDTPPPNGQTPTIEVAGSAVYEGDLGSTRGVAIVQLDRPAVLTVQAFYSITSTDATLGQDYNGVGGNLTIPKGKTYGIIRFPILGDTIPENFEDLTVTLTNVMGPATLGTRSSAGVTILDDDDY